MLTHSAAELKSHTWLGEVLWLPVIHVAASSLCQKLMKLPRYADVIDRRFASPHPVWWNAIPVDITASWCEGWLLASGPTTLHYCNWSYYLTSTFQPTSSHTVSAKLNQWLRHSWNENELHCLEPCLILLSDMAKDNSLYVLL